VWTAPEVKPGQHFFYFDPIDTLSPEAQKRWANPAEHQAMIDEALALPRR
jgi:lysine 2,3-aminomutase